MGHRWDIQILRALAVLAVVGYHSGVPHLAGGSLGVDVFFVISGYLITATWLRNAATRGSDLRGFLRHRMARTLPAAAVMVAVVTVVVLFVAPDRWGATWWHVPAALTGTENLLVSAVTWGQWSLPIDALTPYTHLWSMSMELQFYVAWPLVLGGLLTAACVRAGWGGRHRALAGLLVTVIVLSVGAYVAWGLSSHALAYFSPLARVWQLAAGALIALFLPGTRTVVAGRGAAAAAVALFLAGLAGLAWCAGRGGYAQPTDSPLWGVAVVVITATLIAGGRALPPLAAGWSDLLRPLLFVGTVSYGLYLWHLPLLWTVAELGWNDKSPLWWAAVLGVSLSAASLSWYRVELPAIRWARRQDQIRSGVRSDTAGAPSNAMAISSSVRSMSTT